MYDHIDHKILFEYHYQNLSIDKFRFTCNKKLHEFQKSKHAKDDLIISNEFIYQCEILESSKKRISNRFFLPSSINYITIYSCFRVQLGFEV